MSPEKQDSTSDPQWWVAESGKHHGPFTSQELLKRIRLGKINRDTLICPVGGDAWKATAENDQFNAAFESSSTTNEPTSIDSGQTLIQRLQSRPANSESLRTVFRNLLIAEISFTMLSLVLAIIGAIFVGQYAPAVETTEGSAAFDWISAAFFVFILVVLLPCQIIAWIGLFGLKNWARWLHLGLFVLVNLLYVMVSVSDFSFSWALSNSVESIGYAFSGAVLSLAFMSQLADQFLALSAASSDS
jgi:hypothetical protein